MNDWDEFRRNAENYRARAAKAGSKVSRAELLRVAQQWAALAAEQERYESAVARATSGRPH